MEVRQKSGVTLVNARKLGIAAREEAVRRAAEEKARAMAAAQAKKVELEHEEAMIVSPHHGLQDPELVKILQSGSIVREARAAPRSPSPE